MLVYHLEPEEFVEQLFKNENKDLDVNPYVLDCGIAGMVYSFHDNEENIYFLDRMYVSKEKQEEFSKLDKIAVHAELYQKFCFDHRNRMNMNLA